MVNLCTLLLRKFERNSMSMQSSKAKKALWSIILVATFLGLHATGLAHHKNCIKGYERAREIKTSKRLKRSNARREDRDNMNVHNHKLSSIRHVK